MTDIDSTRSVLLIDMGGPNDLSEVQPYLQRIFSDPFIIPGNPVKRWFLSRLIARKGAAETRERYALIGGKSNAVENAQALADALTEQFANRGVRIDCAVATRYTTPDIQQGLAALPIENGNPVTPVYLFPHETSALTGSCERILTRAADKKGVPVDSGVRHLGVTETYIENWALAIREAIQRPAESFVVMSVHSLPMSIVNRGDPYVDEVQRSAGRIQALIGEVASSLAYQSQEGNDWLEPRVEDVAAQARKDGYRDLIVAPLSFICDNTETLVDLDRDLRQAVEPLGFERFVRIETPVKRGFLGTMVAEALCREWGLEP
jgi:ferrochelatase